MTRTSRSVISRVPRRVSPRMVLAGAALLVPVLAGCEAGINSGTASFHPVGFGAYATSTPGGTVTVNNAFILGPQPGQTLSAGSQAGLFLSLYSTNGDQLQKITAADASSVQLLNGAVDVPANGTANLNGPTPELVLTNLTSDLSGGQSVTVKLQFANAGIITLAVPVMPDSDQYATFQPPQPALPTTIASTSAAATSTATATSAHSKKHHHPQATPSPTP